MDEEMIKKMAEKHVRDEKDKKISKLQSEQSNMKKKIDDI